MFNIIILSLLNGFVFASYVYFVSYFILQRKTSSIKKVLLALIPFLLMYYCILCLLESTYTIFFSGLCAFLFIKIVFEENIFVSLFISLIIHATKIFIKILILTLLHDKSHLLINTYKTMDWPSFYINLVTLIFASIIIYLLRNKLRDLIKYVTSLKHKRMVLLATIYAHFILIYIYQPPHSCCLLQTVTDMIMIFTITAIGIFNVSSEMKMENLSKHYKEIFEYSNVNAELILNYKMQVHEYKNKLLMINSMLDDSEKKVKKYVNALLKEMQDNRNSTNYWMSELKSIPFPGVRNFINYKLEQLKELGAEIEIFISSELEKIDTSSFSDKEYNELTTILGVILDNMIESIKETDERLVSLNIYLENNTINCDFVNSFSTAIDMNRLNEIGYSTKGEKHGVGLSLVAKIVKSNSRFECVPEVMDNFFIQHLIIKLFNKRNYKKTPKKNYLSQNKNN